MLEDIKDQLIEDGKKDDAIFAEKISSLDTIIAKKTKCIAESTKALAIARASLSTN